MFNPKKSDLFVTCGTGSGQTQLAAFDAALLDAGIANFNLIKLSSIVPPYSSVVKGNPHIDQPNNFGKKLYVVLAEKRESEKGREAWAGLGWVQTKDGRGLFVEEHGAQQAEVMRLIRETLSDMVKNREDEFGEIHYQVVGLRCEDNPICALVAAVYKVEGWD